MQREHYFGYGDGMVQSFDTGSTALNAKPCDTPPPDPNNECLGNYYWDPDTFQYVCESPIIIATGKDQSYRLTSAADGVLFDIDGDGIPERVAWTLAGDEVAFLAYDKNGNGIIDDGSELFGNHTRAGSPNGFDALAKLSGAIARLDADNPFFERLLLWTDRNHNGFSEASELRSFGEQFASVVLGYEPVGRRDGNGNLFRFHGFVHERTRPGKNPTEGQDDMIKRSRSIYDVWLQVAR